MASFVFFLSLTGFAFTFMVAVATTNKESTLGKTLRVCKEIFFLGVSASMIMISSVPRNGYELDENVLYYNKHYLLNLNNILGCTALCWSLFFYTIFFPVVHGLFLAMLNVMQLISPVRFHSNRACCKDVQKVTPDIEKELQCNSSAEPEMNEFRASFFLMMWFYLCPLMSAISRLLIAIFTGDDIDELIYLVNFYGESKKGGRDGVRFFMLTIGLSSLLWFTLQSFHYNYNSHIYTAKQSDKIKKLRPLNEILSGRVVTESQQMKRIRVWDVSNDEFMYFAIGFILYGAWIYIISPLPDHYLRGVTLDLPKIFRGVFLICPFLALYFSKCNLEKLYEKIDGSVKSYLQKGEGLFLASLLAHASREKKEGDTYYIHLDKEGERNKVEKEYVSRLKDPYDRNKVPPPDKIYWRKGSVTQVSSDHMSVKFERTIAGDVVLEAKEEKVKLNEKYKAEKLVKHIHDNAAKYIRYVKWETIVYFGEEKRKREKRDGGEITEKSETNEEEGKDVKGGGDENPFGESPRDPNAKAANFRLSEKLESGAKIDFFISHSWKDDAVKKLEAIKRVGEEFLKEHDRYPTFWFDKCCIDQDAISDTLSVLPCFVTASDKMLVLCGETYVERLWCIWELYTLLSFAEDVSEMLQRKIAVKDVRAESQSGTRDNDSESHLGEKLKCFSYKNSKCYDPNEEEKLYNVIKSGNDTMGQNFDSKIVGLGEALIRYKKEVI